MAWVSAASSLTRPYRRSLGKMVDNDIIFANYPPWACRGADDLREVGAYRGL
jgi:hypothetical protein